MAFPLTHLCVAYRILEKLPSPTPELFMLGAIAPDAVHFREEFQGATQSNIGPAKKITHLCPVSEEKWGYVTDNEGWIQCVKDFLHTNTNSVIAAGYAVHVLTDIFNNMGVWHKFVTNHPEEAAKGYASNYYQDLRNIDLKIYNDVFKDSNVEKLLQNAIPQSIPGLISSEELHAIQHNLLYTAYASVPEKIDTITYFFINYEQTIDFINDAADFCVRIILSN